MVAEFVQGLHGVGGHVVALSGLVGVEFEGQFAVRFAGGSCVVLQGRVLVLLEQRGAVRR